MSTTNSKQEARIDAADEIGQMIGDFIDYLHRDMGIPRDIVLAGAHAQIVAMIIDFAGPEVAASSFHSAADRAHQVAEIIANPLSAMPAGGSA